MNKKLLIGIIVAFVLAAIAAGILFWQGTPQITVKVVINQPLQGRTVGKCALDSARLAFELAGYKAGPYNIGLIELDDSLPTGAWDAKLEEANANRAASDPDVVAFIGPQNSGAAKVSMPILNRAGIVQISQANTWPGLTKPGFAPGEPGIYYPTGVRHYFRMIATDDLQGPAAALWTQSLGYKSVYIVDDGEVYGKGIADLFRHKSEEIGLTVLVQETIDKKATDFGEVVKRIMQKNPDLVYMGLTVANGSYYITSQLREAGYQGALMGPDAIAEKTFTERAGKASEGVYATSVGLPAVNIGNAKSEKYRQAYLAKYNTEPEIFCGYAYEAANILIEAIKIGGKDRAKVLQAVRDIRDFDSMFGLLSFDQNGDITQKVVSANVVKDGKFQFVKKLLLP